MESSRFRVLLCVALVLFILGSLQAAAQPVLVPGTDVTLQPPAGFELVENFPGFQSVESQASIMVTKMPAPVAEIRKAMTQEMLATRGIKLLSSREEKVSGREALLLQVSQSAAGVDYLKWMLVTGDPKETFMIVGTYPKSAPEEVGAAIRSALLSTSLAAAGPGDPFEGLLFQVTPTEGLKIAGRMSNMLLLTETGEPGPHGPGEPIYIVGSSIGPGGSGDLKAFSEARARKTEQITDLRNVSGREINVGGLAAYEIVADAKDKKSGTPIRFYQVIAPDGGGYFIVQGLVGAERGDEMLPEFRRVTESFRKTR